MQKKYRIGEIAALTEKIRKFRDERDWKQFHNHKDMAISLVLEATEVLEHFQWRTPEEGEERARSHKEELADELADVTYFLFELADNLKIDLGKALISKLEKNVTKYPIEKSKGKNLKYTELK